MKKRSSKEILAEALLSLASRAPLDKITVKQIVAESGLSLQTFYNHFSDKYELILWLHLAESDRLIGRLGRDGYNFYDLLRDYARYYSGHRAFFINAIANTHGQDSYAIRSSEHSYTALSEYIKEKHSVSVLPEEVDVYLRMFVCATNMVFFYWASTQNEVPPDTLARFFAAGMPEGLKPYLLE